MSSLAKNPKLLCAFHGLQMSLFPMAIITVFFKQDIGMSMGQIMLLQGAFGLAMVLFEFPSGYLADRMGRRKTLVLAPGSGKVGFQKWAQSQCTWVASPPGAARQVHAGAFSAGKECEFENVRPKNMEWARMRAGAVDFFESPHGRRVAHGAQQPNHCRLGCTGGDAHQDGQEDEARHAVATHLLERVNS